MLTKRTFMGLAAMALFAACNSITEIERAQKDIDGLKLNAVNVDMSDLVVTTEGRSINKTTAEVQEDLRRAITAEAQKRSKADGLPANINVKVEKIRLARFTDRVLAGTSFVASEISVTEAETGAFLIEPVKVKANAEQLRGPGPIGAATAAATTLESDYKNVINAYARTLIASLESSR